MGRMQWSWSKTTEKGEAEKTVFGGEQKNVLVNWEAHIQAGVKRLHANGWSTEAILYNAERRFLVWTMAGFPGFGQSESRSSRAAGIQRVPNGQHPSPSQDSAQE